MNSLIGATIPSPTGSLETYMDSVAQLPVLTLEREQSLARCFQQDGDIDAARELVISHLRFVVRVARGYAGYGLQLGDLIQEGNIGLMKAVKRFDPDVGVRLVSFAVHWVRAEMHEFIIKNWRIVKVATTKAQRKLFFNLRSQKKRLGWMNAEEVAAVAKDLNVSARDVLLMEQRLNASDAAYDNDHSEELEQSPSPANFLADFSFEPLSQLQRLESLTNERQHLVQALANLDERSRDIIESRWLKEPKSTLKELARKYTISAERIRQIEQRAFDRLREDFANERSLSLID
ncbi:MAG: RNA polymerase sigma factor RpoH [Pseudomonadota bacterium]